ncbi:MAG: glutathione S-transferase family protein [Pseudomonadota bacterium]
MYRLFGMEVSPYSVKVRALLRFKQVPFEWLLRSRANESAFREHAKVPLIPLLVTPTGPMQDSTPMLSFLEAEHPTPSIRLTDPLLNFLSDALEEAADEWLIKPMFHYRWNYEADRHEAGLRIATASVDPGTDPSKFAEMIGAHLMTRREPLGCSEANAPLIERYLLEGATRLNAHLQARPFLFGDQLSAADLGLGSLYYELYSDPTPSALLRPFSALSAWAQRCMNPEGLGAGKSESWDSLSATLRPVLEHELSKHYLPWARANAAALAHGDGTPFTVSLGGMDFTQPAQKYPAKSWRMLQESWAGLTPETQASIRAVIGEV